jgi:predicted nucleic acid-binding protein
VIIDFLANRQPFALEAAQLFQHALKNKIVIYISAVSYNNIYYILRQSCSQVQTIKILNDLNEWTQIIDVSKQVIQKALASDFKDFEDAIQFYCAKSLSKIDYLVTRDSKHFKTSSIPVFSPKEALSLIDLR